MPSAPPAGADEVVAALRRSPWFVGVLEAAAALGLPDWWIGAGAVRDLFWDQRHHGFDPARVRGVDVVYFDPDHLERAREEEAERRLAAALPTVPWDVKNQAAVHRWYERRFGVPVDPLRSIEEAVATWPETASAVAVTLRAGGTLALLAPLGLDDLLAGVWRHNPRRATAEEYRRRLARKRPQERWPFVRVVA